MARCALCKATGWNRPEGWLFTEFHGPVGNKYGVYCPDHPWGEIRESLVGLAESAAVAGLGGGSVPIPVAEVVPGEIRRRREELDAAITAGAVEKPKPLTYGQKGPSIRGGPEGWRKDAGA